MKTIEEWDDFFKSQSVDNELKQKYLQYIYNINISGAPVIFEIEHFAYLNGISRNDLNEILYSPNSFYRIFTIPKRSGGERIIKSPYPLLHSIQKWILENILSSVELHNNAFAYRTGKSIIDNAKIHLNCNEMLTLDLVDFFGSIKQSRIASIFKVFGYSKILSYQLSSLCCLDNGLPQGACTSPMLSNIVAKRLDYRLSGLAKKFNLKYTRYADDLTFSGSSLPVNLISICRTIISNEGFRINEKKIKLKRCNTKKVVTGLNVHGKELTVQRNYKRDLRMQIHTIRKYGLLNFLKHKNHLDPLYLDSLIGKINFLLNVEPSNSFGLKAKEFLSQFKKNQKSST
ncbi:retron St85 family RNA-directed DNA polymerase [Leptospira sp. 96542]|nr:retron St85 family RNA-directed DNA polymerase [Leptospira sp. 96542]